MINNVVVVVIDALRWDRVGNTGLTPHIDDLAAEGVTFTNAFSTANVTDSAVTSLQTGLYPLSHGILNHGRRVTQDEKRRAEQVRSLPQILSDEGFKTIKTGRPLGRWHRTGFEIYPEIRGRSLKSRVYNQLRSIHPLAAERTSGLYRAFEPLVQRLRDPEDGRRATSGNSPINELVDAIGDRPFYGFVHLMGTHRPYECDEALAQELEGQNDYDAEALPEVLARFPEDCITAHHLRKFDKTDSETGTTADLKSRYDASVLEADRKVGQLARALRKHKIFDETLIVITADHGESLDEHGIYFDHHGLYDQTIRIPLVLRIPGRRTGKRSHLVQITDIFPTVIESLDVGPTHDVDGRSLNPIIEDPDLTHREAILAEERHTQARRAIRTEDYKFIRSLDGDTGCRYCGVDHAPGRELYAVQTDTEELDNLLEQKECVPNVVETLERHEDRLISECETGVIAGSGEIRYENEEEIFSRLDALGYK